MDLKNSDSIFLTDLAKGFPAITPVFGATLAEACAVCLSDRKQPQGVNLIVEGNFQETFNLYWQPVTPQMLRFWNDLEYTTEQAALGSYTNDSKLPFQNKARLEVSGIRSGDEKRINIRVKQKLEQTKPSDGAFPAYIFVIEFSKPIVITAKK